MAPFSSQPPDAAAARGQDPPATFTATIAPLLAPAGAATAWLASPRLARAWAEVLVMHWGRIERQDGLDLGQPLYVLDFAPGDGSLAAWLLAELQQELHARGMAGWPVRYVLCPLPGAPPAEALLLRPPLQGWAGAGWLDCASWQARSGHPLLLGGSRFPLFGARNPVAAVCAGGLSGLPAQLYGVHLGQLLRPQVEVSPAADGQLALACAWLPGEPPALSDAEAVLLAGYRSGVVSAPVLLSEPGLAFLDALADFSGGRYLLLAADRGSATLAGLREGELAPPAQSAPGAWPLPVNFHALARYQEAAGARVANLRWGGVPAVLHLACRERGGAIDDAGWQSLVRCADGGHPADRWWQAASSCGVAEEMAFRLRQGGHDPWILALLLDDLQEAGPERLAEAGEPALAALRAALRATWRHVPAGRCGEALRLALLELLVRLADWPLAHEVLEGAPAACALQRGQVALACGDTPAALAHLRRHLQQAPDDAAARELAGRLEERLRQHSAGRWLAAAGRGDGPLSLEPLDALHVDAWLRQLRDPLVARLAGLPPVQTPQQAGDYLATVAAAGGAEFAVMHARRGLVGVAGAALLEDMAHVHFWIGADHQGCGFGQAALRLLCEALRGSGTRHAFASALEGNERSRRTLARAGFRCIGREQADAEGHLFLHLALDAAPAPALAELRTRAQRVCTAIGAPLRQPLED